MANRISAPLPDGQVAQGLSDVGLAHADWAVQNDRLPGVQPAQRGQVADLRGGQLRGGLEVEAFHGGLFFEPGPAQPLGQRDARAAGDLVFAQDLQEVQVAEVPGVGLGQPGVEGGQHAGQFQVP